MKRLHDEMSTNAPAAAWQSLASALLPFAGTDRLCLCFDLDHTLWPLYCYEETHAPYQRVPSSVPGEVCVSYSDGAGGRRTLTLFPQAVQVIRWCHDRGITLSICSKSRDESAARGILEAAGLWSFFRFPQIYNRRKSTHFRMLKGA